MFGNHKKRIFLPVLVFILSLPAFSPAQAALKDSDTDGLTDSAEVDTYHTDPNKADTDGDGFADGDEVVSGTDPLDAGSNTFSNIEKNTPPSAWLDWNISRTGSAIAFALLAVVIISGLLIAF